MGGRLLWGLHPGWGGGRSADVGAGGQCPKPDPALAWGGERGFAWGRGYRCKCLQAWGSGDSPQRLGEGHGPQDEPISSVEATWKYRPSIPQPSGRQGNPGKVEVTVHSGSVSCVRPCQVPVTPSPAPPSLQRALLGHPGGAKQAPPRAAPARWAAPPERDKVSGEEPSSHTSQPSATLT